MHDAYPYYLANLPVAANAALTVTDKHTLEPACRVALADGRAVDEAIAASVEAFEALRQWPAFRRRAVLEHVTARVAARKEELAEALVIEAGKPITFARGEVDRCVDTFRVSMEESTRINGEWMDLEISPRAAGCQAIWKRVPVGPCSFILPFNFPLNLAAHKIGPALAVGCPFVLKPDPRTPVSSILLGEILAETDLPAGSFSILPVLEDGLAMFSEDERFSLLSFTGSPEVGWTLKSRAGRKKVVLELGGNAACIVEADSDVPRVVERLAFGAFYQSGQSCISVQRILVRASLYDAVRDGLAARATALKMGDPRDEDTFIGPLISEAHSRRVESWVAQAVATGAKVVCGGRRDGVFFEATLLEGVPRAAKVSCREVFGPVATIEPYDDFESALDIVNDSDFGLQAGVFTRDIHKAFRAFEELEVGGVIINDIPSLRVDSMPYGGVKRSGLGREGIRFAIEDMTERRLMVLCGVGTDSEP